MNFLKLKIVPLVLVSAFWLTVSASTVPITPFDAFGDINCEDEMARLDNFTIQLQNEPSARGVIVFYGGQYFRGRLARRGEAAARAARMKPYMVQKRGLPAERVTVIDGGYAEHWRAELWIVSAGVRMPTPKPTIPAHQIKFRKGKASARDYRCQI